MPIGTPEVRLPTYDQLARTDEQSADDWRMTGINLRRERERGDAARSRQMWSVGDWLMLGEDRVFNRLKKQRVRKLAAEITGYSQHTLVMAVSVARKVDPSVRVDGLSWWHHLAVARLPKPEQADWLCQAAEHGWSIRALRARLRQHGRTSSRPRPRRGEQLIQQVVALGPGEVGDDLLAQLHDWLDTQLRDRRRPLVEASRVPASG
jgi:hypothetical protein